jgi:predicted protein tyrosine phosphatase
MISDVLFCSLEKFRATPPCPRTVVVSILDNSEAPRRPSFVGFRDALALTFEDTYEESCRARELWPAEPTDEEHARFATTRTERVPALSDAVRIVSFLESHHRTPDALHLLVHCYGGISRSAAVAHWAAVRFRAPILDGCSTDFANKRLLRLLDAASGRR